MKSFKQTTLRTATIAAMFVTLGAVAVSAQDPGAPPPVSQGADGGSWQGGPAPQFGAPGDDGPGNGSPGNGGPGGQFGGPGGFGGPRGRGVADRFGGPEGGGPGGRFGGPQGGPGGFGGPGGKPSVTQIPAKALAVLLGLNADQTLKISEIQKDARPPRPAAFRPGGRGQDGPLDPQERGGFAGPQERGFAGPQEHGGFPGPQGRRGAGSEAQKKAKADIMAVLTTSQKARLPEITDEVCALRAARIPLEALPSLGLSGDQQKKIASIGAEGSKKIAALITGDANDEDDAPGAAMQDVHEAMGDDVSALLTSDQRAKVRSARREFRPEGGRGGMMPPRDGRMGRNAGEEGMPPPPRDGGNFAQGPGGRGRMGRRGPGGQPGPDMQGGPGMGGGDFAGPPPPDGPPADGGF